MIVRRHLRVVGLDVVGGSPESAIAGTGFDGGIRPWLADRLAVTLFNRQQIAPEHFVEREGGAVEFSDAGRSSSSRRIKNANRKRSTIRCWIKTYDWRSCRTFRRASWPGTCAGTFSNIFQSCRNDSLRQAMLILVTDDVSTVEKAGLRRLRRVARACEDYGTRVQKSVFERQVGQTEWVQLKKRLLREIITDEDSLRFYYLNETAKQRI